MNKCKIVFLWVDCVTFATDPSQIGELIMQELNFKIGELI